MHMRCESTNLQTLTLKKEDCVDYDFALIIKVAVLDAEEKCCTYKW